MGDITHTPFGTQKRSMSMFQQRQNKKWAVEKTRTYVDPTDILYQE